MARRSAEISSLLQDWSDGDERSFGRLVQLVFDDLRRIADHQLQDEPGLEGIEPTYLVNEVLLRLHGSRPVHLANREQFYALVSLIMRRVLIDAAKARRAEHSAFIAESLLTEPTSLGGDIDLDAFDRALEQLAAIDPRQSQIVELRYFLGMTTEEIAELLDVPVPTVKSEWQMAKIGLHRNLLVASEQSQPVPRTAFDIYQELDLGPGGYAIAPSTETRRGVQEALRRKSAR